MCGIVSYIGKEEALPILINGLKALEYRGYDSAGVAVFSKIRLVKKTVGQVEILEKAVNSIADFKGGLGIAHTRWATHGAPSEANAHPHNDCSRRVFLVHNGIIENYKELKNILLTAGIFSNPRPTPNQSLISLRIFLKEDKDFKTALLTPSND